MIRFEPRTDVARIRATVDHPIVDGDGHLLEFMPRVTELVEEVAGKGVAADFAALQNRAPYPMAGVVRREVVQNFGMQNYRSFWTWLQENTLDRMTATLPRLMYERLDEIGLDYAFLYPTQGLLWALCSIDKDLRCSAVRAFNMYYAEAYQPYLDRLQPVATIPMHTPSEAISEIEFAVKELGIKAITMVSMVPRIVEGSDAGPRIDTLAHDSPYDYDPVWAKCAELKVVPTFHQGGIGHFTRTSRKNFTFNHLGHFAAGGEAICRSLVIGGVPRRFKALRFGFLEGGVAWGCQLFCDLLGHYEKRNKDTVKCFDPRRFQLPLARALLEEFADGRTRQLANEFLAAAEDATRTASDDPLGYDDFAESAIDDPQDIVDIFTNQFFFGCEADDSLSALAFRSDLLPRGVKLNSVMASDIGHWDVLDMGEVVPEAWELVERGAMTPDDFRAFTFVNPVRMFTEVHENFFRGTVIESYVDALG